MVLNTGTNRTTMVITKLQLGTLIWFFYVLLLLLVCAFGQELLTCEVTSSSPISSSAGHHLCDGNRSEDHCRTFAVLRTNSYYSSLSNLSLYLGINRFALAEANEFSTGTEFLPLGQPLLIPLDCQCSSNGFLEAELTKIAVKGESFNGIAQSLEGLTTCKAIQDKNPTAPSRNLADNQHLLVPVRCACPSSSENTRKYQFLLSYPVSQGDTLVSLASSFNTTPEDILSANQKSKVEFLVPFSTVIIPVRDKPRLFKSLATPWQPSLPPIINRHKKKAKKRMIGVYIATAGVAFGASLAIAATFLLIQRKRKKHSTCEGGGGDLELQQLGLSVRTTSEKKASFEGSHSHDDSINGSIIDSTPHNKTLMEAYAIEELKKATEDFSSANLIEDSVYHGRLSGKYLAIKKTPPDTISKIEWALFFDAAANSHRHPNIIRVLGTCTTEAALSPDHYSYLVFEYAKNGSLKDWLHGGLAMKSQFIASCYCFLTWNQRLRICLDVGVALQYMHHIMSPPYIHRNIKSRNIFLDEEFKAKIGNFAMAKCVPDNPETEEDHHHRLSSPIQPAAFWNRGYLAPEYVEKGVISTGTDIFAYGVVMLEILSGQTPITKDDTDREVRLSEKIKLILRSENADELRKWIDTAVGENYSFDTAVTLANLARACVEDDPSLRPSSGEIVEKLSRLIEELPETDLDHQFSSAAAAAATISESSSEPLVKTAAENPV